MKKSELKNMTEAELKSKLSDDLEELENLRFQKALQQLENPIRIRLLKREVAQIRTVLREFELNLRKPEGA